MHTVSFRSSISSVLGIKTWLTRMLFVGRSWSIQELREKSWDDLHALWWVCVKERNRIATSNLERERLKAGYGEWESSERERVVSKRRSPADLAVDSPGSP